MNNLYVQNYYDKQRYSLQQQYSKDLYYKFFSKDVINYISNQITLRLTGVHPENKNIIIPIKEIISVMDSIYNNSYRDVDTMIIQTISYIVDYIRLEYQILKQNNNLNIWVQSKPEMYDMTQVPKIKVREKRPTPFIFNMNY